MLSNYSKDSSKSKLREGDASFRHLSRKKKRLQRIRQKRYHRQNDIPECDKMEMSAEVAPVPISHEPTDDFLYLEALLNGQVDDAKTPDQFSCRILISPYDSDSMVSAQSAQRTSLAPVPGVYPNDQDYYNQSRRELYDSEQQPIYRRPSFLQHPYMLLLTRSFGYYCGEKAKWAAEFLAARPALLMVILMIIAIYFLLSLMEMSLVILMDPVIRFLWTHTHWLLVLCGQGFRSMSNWFYTADHVTEAWFCDFADAWCSRFNILCDRRCSHVDRALERLRPHDL